MYRYIAAESADDYLYHVTLVRNLDSIAEEGLWAGTGDTFSGYGAHAENRLFLSDHDAVRGWMHKVFYAGHETDYAVEEGFIPVVLRVPVSLIADELVFDELGTRDVPDGESFFIKEGLDAEDVEVYTPSGWTDVYEGLDAELRDHAYAAADKEIEDDEKLVWPDEHVFRPSF